jgi:hypothetical protein
MAATAPRYERIVDARVEQIFLKSDSKTRRGWPPSAEAWFGPRALVIVLSPRESAPGRSS